MERAPFGPLTLAKCGYGHHIYFSESLAENLGIKDKDDGFTAYWDRKARAILDPVFKKDDLYLKFVRQMKSRRDTLGLEETDE